MTSEYFEAAPQPKSSYKNLLQEIFQKRDEPLPIYNTLRVGGSNTNPLWKCTITAGGKTFSGGIFCKKVQAEQDTAKIAYQKLCNSSRKLRNVTQYDTQKELAKELCDDYVEYVEYAAYTEEKSVVVPTEKVSDSIVEKFEKIVFADLENCPQVSELVAKPDTIIIGVVGHSHPLAEKNLPIYKCVIQDSTKDAADHALTFLAGKFSNHIRSSSKIYIFSKDHFAQVTAKCLKDFCGLNAVHVAQFQQLLALLSISCV